MEKQGSPHIGSLIGRGRVAEVLGYGDDLALKLFYEGSSPESIKQEARICRMVHEAGLATPEVRDVVKVNGRLGIVYDRLSGPSMLTEMSEKPWKLIRSAKTLAELHASMHDQTIPKLPSQRQVLRKSITSVSGLGMPKIDAALKRLDALPDGEVLCHGDFHPDNIVMTAQGAVIIDWTTATKGHPLADVARTSLLLQLGELPPGSSVINRWKVQIGRGWFHKVYLRHYFRLRPEDQQQLAAWQLPIVIARLADGIQEEKRQLHSIAENLLKTSTK